MMTAIALLACVLVCPSLALAWTWRGRAQRARNRLVNERLDSAQRLDAALDELVAKGHHSLAAEALAAYHRPRGSA